MDQQRSLVERDTVRTLPILRYSLRRPFGVALLFFVPGMTVVVGFVVWTSLERHLLSPSLIWAPIAIGVSVTAPCIWFLTLGQANYGIELTDAGVLIYDRVVLRSVLSRREFSWDSLQKPAIFARLWGTVRVDVDGSAIGLWLSNQQARAVLTDPRYPSRGNIPPDVALRLGIPGNKA